MNSGDKLLAIFFICIAAAFSAGILAEAAVQIWGH